jgi:hypothetical protein
MNMTSPQRKAEFYRADNLEAAGIIEADTERYQGALQEWRRSSCKNNP